MTPRVVSLCFHAGLPTNPGEAGAHVIHLTLYLLEGQARALAEICRHFQFSNAQHHLRRSRNNEPDTLYEAITSMLHALSEAGVGSCLLPTLTQRGRAAERT